MNEDLLHFIWKFRLFDTGSLTTTAGERLELLQVGIHNTHSGADFQNAKIKVGEVLWAGNVEIHVRSSDWAAHKHGNDPAYNNVILHVVYEQNSDTVNYSGRQVPVLELKHRVHVNVLSRYEELAKSKNWIPCQKLAHNTDDFTVRSYLARLLIERLETKVQYVQQLLHELNNDWENAAFVLLARYFGASVNKEPFYLLAKSLPLNVWAKHADNPMQVEALVFGQAGFLEERFNDTYPAELRKEYQYLKRLHRLEPLPAHTWKFLRLRPANFPTLRLAQLAAFMAADTKIFTRLLESKTVSDVLNCFNAEVNAYWKNHYHFDKPAEAVNYGLGAGAKNLLLINAVAPLLFAYGRYKASEATCEHAMQLLQACKPEANSIITNWKALGIKAVNASETQALIQLKNEHCNKFACLSCNIGHHILSSRQQHVNT